MEWFRLLTMSVTGLSILNANLEGTGTPSGDKMDEPKEIGSDKPADGFSGRASKNPLRF